MSDWLHLFLGDCVSFQKGRKVETSSEHLEGYLPYLGAGSLVGKGDGFASPVNSVKANENDVLMLWDGERSGLVGSGQEGVVSSTVMKLTPSGPVKSSFLYYLLSNGFEWIQNKRTGTGVPHVPKDLGRIMELAFPASTNIQEKIATILQTVDEAIEKTEALIEKYSQIKTGMMQDLFARGLTSDGKLRPARSEAPELYQETPIGWLPKGWECDFLSSKSKPGVPHLKTGPFGSSLKGEHWVTVGHPVITIGSLGEAEFIESELLYIRDVDANRLAYFKLKLGEVVFSRVADVGRSVVIEKDQIDWIMSSNLMRISLDERKASPHFLQYQLATDPRLRKQIRQKVNAGGRDVANSEILNSLLFVWPDVDEQNAVVERASAFDRAISAERRKLEKLCEQKSGLMNDLLTGERQVKLDDPEPVDV